MALDIRLIRNNKDRDGTCYFEFLPGIYRDKCWNEESVFMDEEVFGFIEPILCMSCRIMITTHL